MKKWLVHTDGGCRDNPGAGAWAFVINKMGEIETGCGFLGHCTNNQAEYRALEAVCTIIQSKVTTDLPQVIEIFSDSQLIVEQINGRWKVNDLIRPYYKTAKIAFEQLRKLTTVKLSWVRREFNTEADALCGQVMDRHGVVSSKRGKPRL